MCELNQLFVPEQVNSNVASHLVIYAILQFLFCFFFKNFEHSGKCKVKRRQTFQYITNLCKSLKKPPSTQMDFVQNTQKWKKRKKVKRVPDHLTYQKPPQLYPAIDTIDRGRIYHYTLSYVVHKATL
jgi:hypothetical protein